MNDISNFVIYYICSDKQIWFNYNNQTNLNLDPLFPYVIIRRSSI